MRLGWLLGWFVGIWARTWRVERSGPSAAVQPEGPVVYAFLHGGLVCLAPTHRDRRVAALISRSRDGSLAAGALRALGLEAIRGSDSSGAVPAVREGLRRLAAGWSVAVAVDGPRGPAGRVAPGALQLARRGGVPLVWVRPTSSHAVQLRSWDRQRVPLPFARVQLNYGLVNVARDDAVAQLSSLLFPSDP
jgi:lysophospholipid acyltransferase (LPLAT)-like uncharacterized protein